jgi:membrane-bound metal-dependent hydrolase YbcI (DUF457 family)
MPSPIAHAAAGLIVALAGEKTVAARRVPWVFVLACMVLAAAPDLDWLRPGFHRGPTHSIGFAVLATLVAAAVTKPATGKVNWRIALMCGLAYATHILMDWLGEDPTVRPGVAALWPFSDKLFMSGWGLFRSTQGDNPFGPTQFPHNVRTLIQETLILGPILLWLLWRRKKQR